MRGWWDSPDALGRTTSLVAWTGVGVSFVATLAGARGVSLAAIAVTACGLIVRSRRDALLALPKRLSIAEERLRARQLSEEQQKRLVEALAPFAGATIRVGVVEDPEAMRLAEQFVEACNRAGLRNGGFANVSTTWAAEGIELHVNAQEEAPPYTQVLEEELEVFGLTPRRLIGGKWADPGVLFVMVGHKPLSS